MAMVTAGAAVETMRLRVACSGEEAITRGRAKRVLTTQIGPAICALPAVEALKQRSDCGTAADSKRQMPWDQGQGPSIPAQSRLVSGPSDEVAEFFEKSR